MKNLLIAALIIFSSYAYPHNRNEQLKGAWISEGHTLAMLVDAKGKMHIFYIYDDDILNHISGDYAFNGKKIDIWNKDNKHQPSFGTNLEFHSPDAFVAKTVENGKMKITEWSRVDAETTRRYMAYVN